MSVDAIMRPTLFSRAWLKQKIFSANFEPGLLGVAINPFFLARRSLFDSIKELAPSLRGRVLDVGCGIKPYRPLFTKATDYVGLEIDTPESRASKNADFFYDGKRFPFKDGEYDGVFFSQVLEHVFNPDEFLTEVHRVLSKDGKVLLTLPFVWDEHEQPYDYARYSSFGLKHLLVKNGFQVLDVRKTLPGVGVLFQLMNAYLFKILTIRDWRLKLLVGTPMFSVVNVMGALAHRIAPRNNDLFLDIVVVAQKQDKKS